MTLDRLATHLEAQTKRGCFRRFLAESLACLVGYILIIRWLIKERK